MCPSPELFVLFCFLTSITAWGGMDWIDLAQYRNQLKALVVIL
jgi:hypothetical protein